MYTVGHASLDDLDELAPLFNAYRVFYEQVSDVVAAREFLHQRMTLRESVILLARAKPSGDALGFVQLLEPLINPCARRGLKPRRASAGWNHQHGTCPQTVS